MLRMARGRAELILMNVSVPSWSDLLQNMAAVPPRPSNSIFNLPTSNPRPLGPSATSRVSGKAEPMAAKAEPGAGLNIPQPSQLSSLPNARAISRAAKRSPSSSPVLSSSAAATSPAASPLSLRSSSPAVSPSSDAISDRHYDVTAGCNPLISSNDVLSVMDNMRLHGLAVDWALAVQAVFEQPRGLEERLQFCFRSLCGGVGREFNQHVHHSALCSSSSSSSDYGCGCSLCDRKGHSECQCSYGSWDRPSDESGIEDSSYDNDYDSYRSHRHGSAGRRQTVEPYSSVQSAVLIAKHFVLSIFFNIPLPVTPTRPIQESPYSGTINVSGRREGHGRDAARARRLTAAGLMAHGKRTCVAMAKAPT